MDSAKSCPVYRLFLVSWMWMFDMQNMSSVTVYKIHITHWYNLWELSFIFKMFTLILISKCSFWKYPSISSFLFLVACAIVTSLAVKFVKNNIKGKPMAKNGTKIKKKFTENCIQLKNSSIAYYWFSAINRTPSRSAWIAQWFTGLWLFPFVSLTHCLIYGKYEEFKTQNSFFVLNWSWY